MTKFFLTSLGCKLNRAEIDDMARRVLAAGHDIVRDAREADWAIVNTCTVTHVAGRKSRQAIRRLGRLNADVSIAVTGCHAEMFPEEIGALPGVARVASNREKGGLIDRILGARVPEACPRGQGRRGLRSELGRTRASVKIQEGCDNRCAYCIVTIARGPSVSQPPVRVLAQIRERLAEGYREIVLTGINIGAYGRDLNGGDWTLARLVGAILEGTAVPRLRLSSIEPWDLSPELLDRWADPRLCRHVHLPLQSGCDATLRRMNRSYATERFADLAGALRQRIPDVAISTDVMVGFPGESEVEFEKTVRFVEEIAFSRLHVFRYSPRPGTVAATLPDPVPAAVGHRRSERLIALGGRLSRAFLQRFLRREVRVLFEAPRRGDRGPVWSGLTDNYLRVWAPSEDDLRNQFAKVRCLSAGAQGLYGALVPDG